jgi:hypothetical protein
MRENRTYGSEGGGGESLPDPYPAAARHNSRRESGEACSQLANNLISINISRLTEKKIPAGLCG